MVVVLYVIVNPGQYSINFMKRSGISSLDMTTTMMRFIFTVFCALFIVINNIFVCDGREAKMIKDWAKVGNFSRFYDKYIIDK